MMTLILALAVAAVPFPDDDAEAIRLLRGKGAKVTETKGVATSADVGDCTAWTEDDFKQLATLTHLKSLSFGPGLGDAQVALLAGLSELEVLQTNLSQVTDDGVRSLAAFKRLKVLKFFHPCKAFTGTGLAALADMPALGSLTVAGSLAFGDEGMAAVGKLTRLVEFRSWHAGQTVEGVKKLKDLSSLQQLTLGQRLAYAPPATVSDETLAVLAGMTSLESLQLEEARLSREALSRLKQLPALKKLTLEGIDLPEADVDALRGDLPNVAIKWTKPNEAYQKRITALFGKR
jgi:hypothetical protein